MNKLNLSGESWCFAVAFAFSGLVRSDLAASPSDPRPANQGLIQAWAGQEYERGAHRQVVEVISAWRAANGAVLTQTNPITVLGTGLFYRDGDRWLPSREEFEPTEDSFVASEGPHRVECPRALDADAAHQLVTSDGQTFRWRTLGLSYHDQASGRSVWIARARDATADQVAPNKLLYRDAFEGVHADLMFDYTKAAFAQDVVLRAQLPDPADWGLAPAHLRIEVVTEFLSAPEPRLEREVVWRELDPARAARLREPLLTHDRLGFGAYRMAPGQVFWVDGVKPDPDPGPTLPVAHRWEVIADRTLLFEHLEYEALRPWLRQLPPHAPRSPALFPGSPLGSRGVHRDHEPGLVRRVHQSARAARSDSTNGLDGPPRTAGPPHRPAGSPAAPADPLLSRESWLAALSDIPRGRGWDAAGDLAATPDPGRIASADPAAPSSRGLVLDWTMIHDDPADITFHNDSTYLVSGVVNLGGTVTFEGGTVVKYTNNGIARLNLYGDVVFRGGPYQPAIFTANADDSVGDVTPRGEPTDYYAHVALQMPSANGTVAHVRITRARTALYFPPTTGSQPADDVRHLQLVNCQNGIVASGSTYYHTVRRRTLYLGNALLTRDPGLSGTSKAISGAYVRGTIEHATLDGWDYFAQPTAETFSVLVVRNSVFAHVATTSNTPRVNLRESVCNGFHATPGFGTDRQEALTPPFATNGGARFYLDPGSPLINRGTNAVNAILREDLRSRTVYPPLRREPGKPFALDTTLGPAVPRDDDDRPDLGWHYPPLDWCWSGLTLGGTNGPATLLLTNGVAVGIDGKVGTRLLDGARFISEGSPVRLNRLVRSELVQEQPVAWAAGAPVPALFSLAAPHPSSTEIRLRLTEVIAPPGKRALLDTQASLPLGALVVRDCQVLGVALALSLYPPGQSAPTRIGLTNNLFRGVTLEIDQDTEQNRLLAVVSARHNRFEGGSFRLADYSGSTSWSVLENEFDDVRKLTAEGVPNSHNAYSGDTALPGSSGNDVLQLSGGAPSRARGGLLASSRAVSRDRLVDAGSRPAAEAGLYHYRTATSLGLEGESQVDIGYHDLPTSEGQPGDTDGDGLPDYFEDANGNGVVDDLSSWTDPVTHPNLLGYDDLDELDLSANILVTDPAQDYATEQNTQYQPDVVVLDDTVLVGFWDTNRGIYGLASRDDPPELCRMVAYAVSSDGGKTFADRDVPPLPPDATTGDAGDPVLAVDRAAGVIYYAATSERRAGAFRGVPLWKSVDRGASFTRTPLVREEIEGSDYPWIAVDDWPGVGQHDVYVVIQGYIGASDRYQWLTVSRDGAGGSWSVPIPVGTVGSTMPQIVVGPDHVAYIAWNERGSRQSLQLCAVSERGTVIGPTRMVQELKTTVSPLRLRRTNATTDPNDWFKAFCLATIAVNPDPGRANHLYVTYADQGQAAQDRADVLFVQSTNGGENWTAPLRVPLGAGTNDEWSPAIAVRPDGNALFIGWHDRRNDPLNSHTEIFGRWASIDSAGVVTFHTNDFRITTEPFPPVFSGSLPQHKVPGRYDPVWPPGGVNLHWWYPWFPEADDWGDPVVTPDIYSHEAGEFNSATADASHVYLVWADNRNPSQATRFPERRQGDIRLARLPWPNLELRQGQIDRSPSRRSR